MASSGNFATLLNGLLYQVGTNTTYSIGNTKYQSSTAGAYSQQASTLAPSSGKWYAEMYVNTVGNLHFLCLVGDVGVSDTTNNTAYPNRTTNGGMGYGNTGVARFNGSDTSSGYSTYTDGDIIQIAFDIDNTKVWFGKNNTWQNSGDPANGTNASYTTWTTTYGTLPKHWHVGSNIANTGATTFNFGQDDTFGGVITAAGNADANGFGDFKYAPPTGFLALCSGNLPISDDIDPAQTDDDYPSKQFNTVLYTGTGSSNTISNLNFQPDLVWIKSRSNANSNELYDSSRGVTKRLRSDTNDAEDTRSSELTGFTSDGFSLGSSTYGGTNYNSYTYVAWAWRANGGTTASNSEGNITSTVQANTKAGFSIITYTGSGGTVSGANPTFGHGLESAPDFLIFKCRSDGSTNWIVWHSGLGGANKYLSLNGYAAAGTDTAWLSNTAPSSTLITTDNGGWGAVNGSSRTYVCYAWHNVSGMQKFGIYEGNGNADGPFVYTGFRPRMVILKDMDRGENWVMFDSERNTYNPIDKGLFPNDSAAETTGSGSGFDIDFLSNGFKLRASHDNMNGSSTYVYACWGNVPFKYNNTF